MEQDRKRARYSRSSSRPAKAGPGKDKAEISPNSMAKCKGCGKKIEKGVKRIVRSRWCDRRDQYEWWYYHGHCVDESVKLNLPGGRSVDDALALQHKQQVQDQVMFQQRNVLFQTLRKLRMEYARRLDVPPFMVMHDSVLQEICVALPQTKEQLCQVKGIGPKKYQSFGTPMLRIVKWYVRNHLGVASATEAPQTPPRRTNHPSSTVVTPPDAATNSSHPNEEEVDDGFLEFDHSLSVVELVRHKFQDAEENGYMIELN
mmetsp:Transcript_14900/g.41177  ORF Transcript_14900/g.41177 Transcript_14900/m.41177 type:complete len:259 (-) Transcript_14900:307-1083(-)